MTDRNSMLSRMQTVSDDFQRAIEQTGVLATFHPLMIATRIALHCISEGTGINPTVRGIYTLPDGRTWALSTGYFDSDRDEWDDAETVAEQAHADTVITALAMRIALIYLAADEAGSSDAILSAWHECKAGNVDRLKAYFDSVQIGTGSVADFKPAEADIRNLVNRYFSESESAAECADGQPALASLLAIAEGFSPAQDQTLIRQSDTVNIMLSKAAREQKDIAKITRNILERHSESDDRAEVRISPADKNGKITVVTALITDRDGGSTSVTQDMIQMQNAIGNLIDRSGGLSALPIVVSRPQIYREYTHTSSDAGISESQLEEIDKIMTQCMGTIGDIDWGEQLEDFKHMKQQPDFEYSEESAKMRAPLINAEYCQVKSNGTTLVDGYRIFSYPLFYRYSHAVGQIGQFPLNIFAALPSGKRKTGTKRSGLYGSRQRSVLQGYLLQEIAVLKRYASKTSKNTITLKTDKIVKDMLGDNPSRKTVKTLRANTEDMLEKWSNMPDSDVKAYEVKVGLRGKHEGYKITLRQKSK